MSVALPEVRVGEALRHGSLSVFPLYTDTHSRIQYVLSDEALASEALIVEEVNEGGSVPDLLVENKSDARILFIEGEELIGAKQNRILNTSILVAAHSKLKIPVSCVEQGRWRYKTRRFGSSGSHSPSQLRYALKKSVSESAIHGRGHRSHQGQVWAEVDSFLCAQSVASPSAAMSDVFESSQDQLAEFREEIKYAAGATGVAVAVGDKVVALDVFDKPSTCEKVWGRLLSGFALDALAQGSAPEGRAEITDVERLLAKSGEAQWKQVDAVGEGEEYRADFKEDHASALTFDADLVHGSVMAEV